MIQNNCILLRELMKKSCLMLPGAYNGMVARQCALNGFQGLYISGAAVTASSGVPDIGMVTLEGFCKVIKEVALASGLPVIADADTGFGEGEMCSKTVWEYYMAGASGLHIEDQVFPKRCGHLDGKELIPQDVMVKKVKVAVEASKKCSDGQFIICARTDARGVDGLEACIKRSKAYIDAGADMIFPEGLCSQQEMATVAQALKQYKQSIFILANMTEFGKTPYLPRSELEQMGYSCAIYPVSTLRIASKATNDFLKQLKQDEHQTNTIDQQNIISILECRHEKNFTKQQATLQAQNGTILTRLRRIDYCYYNMTDYSDKKYWDERYLAQKGQMYDWLQSIDTLRPVLEEVIRSVTMNNKNPKILNVGCGNSLLSEQIYDMGLTNIINIDISDICIQQMTARNLTRPEMKFEVMDVCDMSYEDQSFDWVIDKSTLDALLCGDDCFIQVSKMMFEIQRVLKVSGVYQIISYGVPLKRLVHLNRSFLYFDIQHEAIKKQLQWTENSTNGESQEYSQTMTHYCYNCVKNNKYTKKESCINFEQTIKVMLIERQQDHLNLEKLQEQKISQSQSLKKMNQSHSKNLQAELKFNNENENDIEHLNLYLEELGLKFIE